jgi:integrase
MSDLIPLHIKWLRAGGRSESTIAARERLLWHADDFLPYGLDQAHPDEIADYEADPSWEPWTRFTYDSHLRGYYGWGVEFGHLINNPMAHLIRPAEGERLPDPCTDAELARILAEAPERPWRLVALLAAYEGLRVSECARLERRDITQERLRVRRGKGRKDGSLETHPAVWEAVKDLPLGPVVRDKRGQPVTGPQLTRWAWDLFRKLGMPTMRLHRLRHWHATSLLAGGADLETVRQCMRHSSITSTVGYTLIASKAKRAAVHNLPLVSPVEPEPAVTRLGPATEAA